MSYSDLIAIAFGILLFIILFTHGYASLIAAPWVPTRRKDYARITRALGTIKNGMIADLGVGGGGVMRAIARAYPKVQVVGYEISITAWLVAHMLNWCSGTRAHCEIRMKNFYHEPLGAFNAIYCFLTPMAMKKLKEKFERELKPGTLVVSYAFSIHGWQGEKIKDHPHEIPIFVYYR